MSHTPGPWFVNGHERYTKYVEARIGGGLLQEVAACGPTERQEQQEANARLIAAAPDLLEALIDAEKKLCIAEHLLDLGEDDSIAFESEILYARAAIAKATGQ
ncbi:hypothetical protein DK254_00070 [Pseudomonas sp. RW407]|uniref:hypothetical protein n=1 Tax=Pseudomonas sp. RW407 TaxID=2202894 RepID=UPI000D6FB8DF|nr:hypothetical protein [Pseudomonas sp. RW407]PWU30686.1 hypothetical protein DK254_11490 [Pseudomonas sp. RW407]PWU32119.1 hypothetical protein DK254_00070 [Pseudomonas sp. RW407]